MLHTRTRLLLVAAVFASGILAGTVVDRALVGGPAWHDLGAEAWAQFSRRADLGTGMIAYPVEAIAATLLLIAAAMSSRFDRNGDGKVPPSLIVAIALSMLGLLLTAKAAPIMLSLGTAPSPAAVQLAFDDFFLWGLYLRGVVDFLTFGAAVWALSDLRVPGRSNTIHGASM